ncbi:hypothetical protein MP638_004596 [Amoeboaphelidium occidentale]|nr:hypothetical protein MP638_004596 [Amoeboaphelidium occidentale]
MSSQAEASNKKAVCRLITLNSAQRDLPQTYRFKGSSIYRRDCFEAYYNYITSALKEGNDIVTLTGSPGIGKSIFYLYFFQRYRVEFPDRTIVAASFTDTRLMKRCVVFKPGSADGEEVTVIPRNKEFLHLYDGPPDKDPERTQMVCFTSPNYGWLDACSKLRAVVLYMRGWILCELLEANDVLNLGLTEIEVEKRYLLHGGSVRVCMETRKDVVDAHERDLMMAISMINSHEKLIYYLSMVPGTENVAQRAFYIVPIHEKEFKQPRSHGVVFCSLQVERMIYENIQDRNMDVVAVFCKFVQSNAELGYFLKWKLKCFAIEYLSEGREIFVRPLSQVSAINVKSIIPKGLFCHTALEYNASIDGYLHDVERKKFMMFKTTLKLEFPIDGHDIVKLLQELKLTKDPELRIYFVFVSSVTVKGFKQQRILKTDFLRDGSKFSALSIVNEERIAELAARNIHTVGDLKKAVDAGEKGLSYYKHKVAKYVEMNEENLKLLDRVEQYLYST